MVTYQVFIETAKDPSPQAIARVAAAIAQRFGLPVDAIQQRLGQGRFRAKSNVDLKTARAFATELDRLGAVCTIEDSTGKPVAIAALPAALPLPATLPPPAAKPTQAPTPKPAQGTAPTIRAGASHGPLAGIRSSPDATPIPGGYQSGLSAAFGDEASKSGTDLGALGAADSGAFSLATLDGDEEIAQKKSAAASSAPTDPAARDNLFRPPDEVDGPSDLELAVEKPVRVTPPSMPVATSTDDPETRHTPMPMSAVSVLDDEEPVVEAKRESAIKVVTAVLGNQPRVRLLAGVMLAVLLGFIPATLFASWREGSAYADSRNELHKSYAAAHTVERWNRLDEEIKGQRGVMSSSRQTIAITSILIWGAAGGGFAFFWFRKVPWERFAG